LALARLRGLDLLAAARTGPAARGDRLLGRGLAGGGGLGLAATLDVAARDLRGLDNLVLGDVARRALSGLRERLLGGGTLGGLGGGLLLLLAARALLGLALGLR